MRRVGYFPQNPEGPLRCVHVEICINEQDAKMREKYLQTGAGKRFLKYRIYNYLKGQRFLQTENT